MKVFVINLPVSEERRRESKRQLDALGIDFEFFEGVDGRTSGHPLLERYDEDKFLVHYGRPAKPGEMGCYASHYLAWQKCVELGEPILIMEDDFVLLDGFAEAFSACAAMIGDYGYIRLQTTRRARAVTEKKLGNFTLVKYTRAPQSLNCYAIAPRVAERFVSLSGSFEYPVDVFVRHFCFHKVPLYGLTPYVTHEGVLAHDSIIGKRTKVRKSLRVRIKRFLHKANVHLQTALENARYVRKS